MTVTGLLVLILAAIAAVVVLSILVIKNDRLHDDQPRRPFQDIDPTRYQPHPTNVTTAPKTEIFDLDGVSWHEAPIPPRRHRCWPQTAGVIDYFTTVERCACGAINYDAALQGSDYWMRRNERRANKS